MQAGKVIELVYEWAIQTARIEKALQDSESQGRYLLALIYVSEERGATESEMLNSIQSFPPSQVLMLLGKLEQDLLIYSREGDKTRSYHGFREMAPIVLPLVLKERMISSSATETVNWISYRHFLTSHLSHFLSQVALGSIKITQGGDMHRKDQQELSERFTCGEKLSSVIPGEEVQFLLHFCCAMQLVLQQDGILHLSGEAKALLKGTRTEAWKNILKWWTTKRVFGMSHSFKALAWMAQNTDSNGNGILLATPTRISPWANLFWIFSGTQRKGYQDEKASYTWENLPKVLQELWLLGLVDFGMAKGRIAWMRPVLETLALADQEFPSDVQIKDISSSRPISLPNLESLVPLDSPFAWQSKLELVGNKSNDEFMVRYHFTKEAVIKGLQCGLPMNDFVELLTWLGFEAPARRTLTDWASTYASTLFMDALILKVSDPVRFQELQEIPQFMELITETIPNFGFVLSRINKPMVKELLEHFGLVPGEDSRRVLSLENVVLSPVGGTWELPRPVTGLPDYRETTGNLRAVITQPHDKFSVASREQELMQIIAALEEAIVGEKKVEFSYPTPIPKRISLRPILLLKHRNPVKLIGIELDSGHRNEYLLENVKALGIKE